MKIAFEQEAFADFTAWAEQDRKIYKRIVTLILDIVRNPHEGAVKIADRTRTIRTGNRFTPISLRRIDGRRSNSIGNSLAASPAPPEHNFRANRSQRE